jgi:hypothetical protein
MAKIANGGRLTAEGYRANNPASGGAPADMVTFTSPDQSRAHHIGIVAGKGLMINAPHTGARVRYDDIASFGGDDRVEFHRFPKMKKGGVVRKDDTIARLHARETVLPAELSASLREGIRGLSSVPAIMGNNNSSGGSVINEGDRHVNMTVYGAPGQDVSELADILAQREARAEARMGSR